MSRHKVRTEISNHHNHRSDKSRTNMKNFETGKRLLLFCGTVAVLSFILNIVAFVVLFNLQAHTENKFSKISDRLNRNQKDNSRQTTNTANNSNKQQLQLQEQIDDLKRRLNNANTERKKLSDDIDNAEERAIGAEKRINSAWRKGCPQHGLSNGTFCYVINPRRENYTTALESCETEGGILTIIQNKKLLGIITDNFSAGPFFVDAHFSDGYWKTSFGQVLDHFSWLANERGTEGDCVYGYRNGYTRWHCHAHLPYLCLF